MQIASNIQIAFICCNKFENINFSNAFFLFFTSCSCISEVTIEQQQYTKCLSNNIHKHLNIFHVLRFSSCVIHMSAEYA